MKKYLSRKVIRFVALLLIFSALRMTCAQTSIPSTSSAPSFEVSTVKQNKSGGAGGISSHSSFENGTYTATNILLKNIMQYSAYGVPQPRIFGGPKWLDIERFDIVAKADNSVTESLRKLSRAQRGLQMQAMFQKLLADRFKLAVHWETRDLLIYALVVGKKAVTLQPSKDTEGPSGTSAGTGRFSAQNFTMADIAKSLTQELSGELGRVIVDRTGLAGKYDVALSWTPDRSSNLPEATPSAAASGPSIFTAIQEQLGLRLESTKGPVQVLVIDHVEMPAEN